MRDVMQAIRELGGSPGFAIAAILSLALGIGANTAIFTVTNAVLLRPLPVSDPASLAQIETVDQLTVANANFARTPVSIPNFRDFRRQASSFAGIAGFIGAGATLTAPAGAKRVNVMLVTANYFEVLGVKPVIGRAFQDNGSDDRTAEPVALLSHAAWVADFGADPGVVGRKMVLNSSPFVVMGVLPEGFKGTTAVGNPDLTFIPLANHSLLLAGPIETLFERRRFRIMSLVGRLQPAATLAGANAELRAIAANLEREYPDDNKGRTTLVSPLNAAALGIPREQLSLASVAVFASAGLVLLIACVNVANLLLIRAAAREKEFGLRAALGASRGRLVRQLLTGSLLLSAAGGALGWLLGWWGRRVLWSFRPSFMQENDLDLSIDPRVLLFTAGLALATAVLFGLLPAWRGSTPDLNRILRSGGGQGTTASTGRLRSVLVATEVAFSLVALTAAALFLRSMQRTQQVDPGFAWRTLAVVDYDLSTIRLGEADGRAFVERLMRAAKSAAGVADVAMGTARPFVGGFYGTSFSEGQRPQDRGTLVLYNSVSPEFFGALGLKLRDGRLLNDFDRRGGTAVAVVTESMARQMWPGSAAVGKRFYRYGDPTLREVAGVIADFTTGQLGGPPQPAAFVPFDQQYQPAFTLHIRSTGDTQAALNGVIRAVRELEPGMAPVNPSSASGLLAQGLWAVRLGGALFGLFGALALVLAAIGIYGVVAYGASQRRREMGIRIALGATRGEIVRRVILLGLSPAVLGIAVGAGGAIAFGRLAGGLLFQTHGADPLTLGGAAMLIAMVAAVAGWVPAWRSTKADPAGVLRDG